MRYTDRYRSIEMTLHEHEWINQTRRGKEKEKSVSLSIAILSFHFVCLTSPMDSERSTPLTDSEIEDDDDEEENNGPMRGKVTEKYPNYNDKKKCNCRKGCSKRTCSCFKFGSGCNVTCGCGPSCQNIFNHLDYFFGEDDEKPLSASPCFSKWLIQKAKNVDELKMIDREDLKKMILGCRR